MIKSKSDIPFNYATIKLTKSRLDKGLLAIPVSLINLFHGTIKSFENNLDLSENEKQFSKVIEEISQTVNQTKENVVKNEFVRLASKSIDPRKQIVKEKVKVRETVPYSIRKILLYLYNGRCQVSGFTFLMKNGDHYFEIHHINPLNYISDY